MIDVDDMLLDDLGLQRLVDIEQLRNPKHNGYFDEALAMCEEFGLINIMKLHCPYDEELVLQLFATSFFGKDEARTVEWMTKGVRLKATWGEFGALLGYEDKGDKIPSGWRIHDENGWSYNRKVLKPITFRYGNPGKTAHLIPTFDILHRIYRENIAVKVGSCSAPTPELYRDSM